LSQGRNCGTRMRAKASFDFLSSKQIEDAIAIVTSVRHSSEVAKRSGGDEGPP
jgi:hypothetical protein